MLGRMPRKCLEPSTEWEDDIRWAEEHPDEDKPNETMRVLMNDDD